MLLQFSVMNLFFEFLLFIVVVFNSMIFNSWFPGFYYNFSWVEVSLALMSIVIMVLINLSESNFNLVVLSRGIVLLSILFFGAQSVLMMYYMYESLMFLVLILIYLYGSQPEKVSSMIFMIIYTGGASLPFLYVIFTMESWPTFDYMSPTMSTLMLMIFLAKTPIYMAHVWLPRAHVEAPTVGSMLLAGILLKVGIYGVMVVLTMSGITLNWVLLLSTIGFLAGGGFALVSSDTKTLSAYSSVVHMNLVLYALNLFSLCNNSGSLILSVSHGLISCFMFYMVGMLYSYNGTRIVYMSSGLSSYCSYIMLFFLFVVTGNMGIPPLLSFWGEVLVIVNIFEGVVGMILLMVIYYVFVMLYSMYLFMHMTKSDFNSGLNPSVMTVLVWSVLLFGLLFFF